MYNFSYSCDITLYKSTSEFENACNDCHHVRYHTLIHFDQSIFYVTRLQVEQLSRLITNENGALTQKH